MPSSGPLYPSASGSSGWTNPTNIFSDNGSTAGTSSNLQNSNSSWLRGTGFGFAIPAGATIDGIVMECGCFKDTDSGSSVVVLHEALIVKAGTPTGVTRGPSASLGTTEQNVSLGGTTDLWGATLSDTDVNDSGFGVDVRFRETANFPEDALVDYVRLTVYYTEAADTTPPQDPAVSINAGDATTRTRIVTVDTSTSDSPTTGYEQKIWGDVDNSYDAVVQTTEGASQWFSLPSYDTYPVKLSSGDGVKTIRAKLRDVALNTTAEVSDTITLDTKMAFTAGVTPGGAVIRTARKWSIAAITPGGAWGNPKVKKVLAAGFTPTGVMGRRLTHVFTGANTPAGALARTAELFRISGITPAGAQSTRAGKVVAGALTPAGVLMNESAKLLAGTATQTGGLLAKVGKPLSAGITPAGVQNGRLVRAWSGTIATLAGTLASEAGRPLAGSVASAGTLARGTKSLLAGALTPGGALGHSFRQSPTGAITAAGVLVRMAGKPVAGAVATLVGTFGPTTVRSILVGALAPTGSFVGKFVLSSLAFVGSVAPVGTLAERLSREWVGTLTPTGVVLKKASLSMAAAVATLAGEVAPKFFLKVLGGVIDLTDLGTYDHLEDYDYGELGGFTYGRLELQTSTLFLRLVPVFSGTIASSGTLAKLFPTMFFSGVVTPAGTLVRKASLFWQGAITPVGFAYARILGPAITSVLLAPQAVVQMVWSTVNVVLAWVKPAQAVETPDTDAEGRVI